MVTESYHTEQRSTITLYDGGIGPLAWLIFGIPVGFGSIFDYLWNYFVLRFTLGRLKSDIKDEDRNAHPLIQGINKKSRYIYTLIITILGLIIDCIYIDVTWDYVLPGFPDIPVQSIFPGHGYFQVADIFPQTLSILMPMAAIAVVNILMARYFLHLRTRQAVIVGLVMGVFTAPWLILAWMFVARLT